MITAQRPRVYCAANTTARVHAPLVRGAAMIAAQRPRVDRAAETHARVGAFLVGGAAVIAARRPRVDRAAETPARVGAPLLVRETATTAATSLTNRTAIHAATSPGATDMALRIATLLPGRTTGQPPMRARLLSRWAALTRSAVFREFRTTICVSARGTVFAILYAVSRAV